MKIKALITNMDISTQRLKMVVEEFRNWVKTL